MYLFFHSKSKSIMGVVEVSEFQVRAHQDIRVVELRVKEGDYVNIGDTLIIFEPLKSHTDQLPPLIKSAIEDEFHNQKFSTKQLYDIWQEAKSHLRIFKSYYHKAQQQYQQGLITSQERDKAYIDYQAYQAHEQGVRHVYECSLAKGLGKNMPCGFKTCENAVIAEVEGEIGTLNIHEGETVRDGTFMLFIALLDNPWGVFSLTKKEAQEIRKKDSLMVFCHAFNQNIPMKVLYIQPQKKKQKEKKQYVLKAYPTQNYDGLRPGMRLNIIK